MGFLWLPANAQFVKQVDEDGNTTYTDDSTQDYSQDELDESEIQAEQAELEEYLAERERAAQREQIEKKRTENDSAIGIRRGYVSGRINHRKCRFLRRRGLKCL